MSRICQGEVAAKVTDLQESIIALISLLYKSLINFSSIIIGIVFLFVVNYITAVVLISFVALYAPVLFCSIKKTNELAREIYKSEAGVYWNNRIIHDAISNIFSIKIIGSVMSELRLKLMTSLNRWRDFGGIELQESTMLITVDMADTIIVTLMGRIQMGVLIYPLSDCTNYSRKLRIYRNGYFEHT